MHPTPVPSCARHRSTSSDEAGILSDRVVDQLGLRLRERIARSVPRLAGCRYAASGRGLAALFNERGEIALDPYETVVVELR